jgi:RHS repeat-associated protein
MKPPIEQNSPYGQDSTQLAEPSSRNQQSSQSPQSEPTNPEIPSISLPKGGGAIRGIGEKFTANPVTGTGSMSVPITTSPGRSGFGPQLSLSYDSGTGNSPFGFGWNLSLPSITRKTDKGLPRYFDAQNSEVGSDVFILSGAEDLVPAYRQDSAREWLRDTQGNLIIHEDEIDGFRVRHYRPRIEGLFARLERWTSVTDASDVQWRSISNNNVLTIYGKNINSRIADPEDPSRIFSWLICETRDDKGNAVLYEYKIEDGIGVNLSRANERNREDPNNPRRTANRYLKRIHYGNRTSLLDDTGQRPRFLTDLPARQIQNAGWMFEVVFDYGEHDANAPNPNDADQWAYRNDPFSSYRAGFEVRTTRLCQRVLMFHHIPDLPNGEESEEGYDGLVRSTDFIYSHQQKPSDVRNPIYTFLDTATQNSYKRKGNSYLKRNLPPIEFEYTQPVVQDSVEEVDSESLENLPIGVDGVAYQWTDLHGEGIPGILTEQADAWFYKRNVSPIDKRSVEFAPLERVAVKPNMELAGGAQFMDLAGNGRPDLVVMDGPMPGFYEHDGEEGWQPFQSFTSQLNRDTRDPNLRFVDLDGDGQADILITEDDAIVWHPSLAEVGFGPARRVHKVLDEEKGPHLVFADGTQSIYLADFSGDGLSDLARIRNGEVCYWPNLGYGRFGAKVTMDNAPHFDHPDLFDHKRIRLSDIDGSGTTDIIYLHGDGVRLYFNQSGNSWAKAQVMNVFPRVDDLVSIVPTDLLGNGTACLVWSSPLPGDTSRPMRYVNLMGSQKPHLLVKTINNLGAETCVEYAPSTKFYLQDKRDGIPWITKLPFPVHVVEKVTVKDKWRDTEFATTYSYHHGYFDGVEREFRGFGRVEQIDVETYGKFLTGNTDSPFISDDKTLYQPPVKTVTWYHTGVALDRERILSHYETEYFPNWLEKQNPDKANMLGGFRENALPQPDIQSSDLSADEWREAMRACKGIPLRQEVYELDVDALEQDEHKPVKLFSTGYHNCHIHKLQPKADNLHAVFLVTESEAISYEYELDLRPETLTPDPRIAHTFNLNIDEYGNVRQAVAIVYPRLGRHQDPLGAEDLIAQVQGETHLAYTETRYTNDVDDPFDPDNYRLRVPCEVLTNELTGVPKENSHFRLEELQGLRLSKPYQLEGVEPDDLAYHQIPDRIKFEKRIVEHTRMLFFNQDLTNPLELGTLNSLGLPFETYTLALTNGLLTALFGDKLTAEVRGELDNADKSGYLKDDDGQYWIRSGIAGFSAKADQHFFLPERYTDPFGNTTTLNYDGRDLFIKSSTDPVGNTVTVTQFDCRVLAPSEIKDINDNLSEVIFDTLGLPMAVAVKGKGDQADNLLGFENDQLMPDRNGRIQFFTETREDPETIEQFQLRHRNQAKHWLDNATARHLYYFGEIEETLADGTKVIHWGEHPPSACAIIRERHVVPPVVEEDGTEKSSPLQVAFEYSDGGGNVLVSKVQAEPDEEDGPLRWIANGKTILNNKGKPVKQYEPSFTDSHTFEELDEVGVTPVMYYDSAGRLIRTELPDGTLSRVGFSPWHVTSFDANDTVLEPDNEWNKRRTDPTHPKFEIYNTTENQRAAQLAAEHANTPAQVFLDSLGRDVISVEDNKAEKYLTFTKLDAEGKPLWISDARGNLVMQYISPPVSNNQATDPVGGFVPCYDIAGNLLFQHSMDGGDRWMITDAAGQPFYAWDFNNRITQDGNEIEENRIYHTLYDAMRRPLQQQLHINNDSAQVIERIVYGEDQQDDKALNLRGQVFQHYDSSGLMANQEFDFKGNLLKVGRQLAKEFEAMVIHWPEDPASQEDMLDEIYTQNTQYDALNRMTRHENWHIEGRDPAVYTPEYNERGLLVSEDFMLREEVTKAIQNIEHDAKGQRMRIEYGNGTTTRYIYDEETFRLIQLRTTITSPGNPLPRTPSNRTDDNVYQNLYYTYDPVGNITEILDDAYEPVFFKNQLVEPRNLYTYDSLYRLIKATGRENFDGLNMPKAGKLPEVPIKTFPINNEQALRNYTQHYQYDKVGNFEQMKHVAGETGSWTRNYEYSNDSNRLLITRQGKNPETESVINYTYDTHGSMLNLNNVADEYKLRWDSNDMIRHVNLGGGGNAFYNYGSDKERSRKRIESNGNTIKERLYLGGMERYRHWVNDQLVEEIETHHLFDGGQRLLIVEDVLLTDNENLSEGILNRYQYSNHLGSVGLEVDGEGSIISYEEYHPYGTTAYSVNNREVSSTKKCYRYTGMERDEESGLSYHSARYYLPWLGRWGSVDPEGLVDGKNLYLFAKGNPLRLVDPTGTQAVKSHVDKDGVTVIEDPIIVVTNPTTTILDEIIVVTNPKPEKTPSTSNSSLKDPFSFLLETDPYALSQFLSERRKSNERIIRGRRKRNLLSEEEIRIAELVFHGAIDLSKVRITEDEFESFGGYARTLGNTINFPKGARKNKALFIHELTHVWQYQTKGWIYAPRALGAQITTGYDYRIPDPNSKKLVDSPSVTIFSGKLPKDESLIEERKKGKTLSDFNEEQQADIIRDYYVRLKANDDVSAYEPFIRDIQFITLQEARDMGFWDYALYIFE